MIGRVLSHYEVIEKLGEGGMGVVYKARDRELGRLVAIKVLAADALSDEGRRRRFLQEARTASALNHPNIVTIHDIGHTEGLDFIVMEYVEGRPLKSLTGAPLPVKEAVGYARQMAAALAAAHAAGIIHRDVKPANVMVTAASAVKVLDFGLAKLTERASLSDNDPTMTGRPGGEPTELGAVLGTASYMSPEQAEGKPVDERSDIFSLGIVLYEMLSGRRPFHGDSNIATMMAILRDPPPPLANVPGELARIAGRALEKNREARYATAAEMERDLAAYLESLSGAQRPAAGVEGLLRRPGIAAAAVVIVIALVAAGVWNYQRGSRLRWARERAIPEIAKLAEEGRFIAAFDLAAEADRLIPGNPQLARLWPEFAQSPPVDTTPSGAAVSIQEYGVTGAPWRILGKSPLQGVRIPNGFYLWKAEKDGYEPSFWAANSQANSIAMTLDLKAPAPSGMVAVQTGLVAYSILGIGFLGPLTLGRFHIDRYEVTNRAFKEFVDAGGYQKTQYWRHPFRKDGRTLTWEQAMAEFVDTTGKPGPSTWEAGSYRAGEEDLPAGGVSWYEAAAYAEFAGKQLPTIYHWYQASTPTTAAYSAPVSNFDGKGAARVGSYAGVGPFGTYDMAGNVKEWCWNQTDDGRRFILGGGWNEPSYNFVNPDARVPFDRSPANGFRCVRYEKPPAEELLAARARESRDYSTEKPVSDDAFRVIRSLYAAERGDLRAKVESVDDSAPYWRTEKVSFQAAYGAERVSAYLFLPKQFQPPYSALVFFPGAGAVLGTLASPILDIPRIDYLVRSGRAVIYPVYYGTFDRRLPSGYNLFRTPRQVLVRQFQDLARSVDYLESRPDIDRARLAYYGLSLGSRVAAVMLSMEDRFKTAVLLAGGFHLSAKPLEVDEFTFAPRVKLPLVMVNGRHDYTFPYEASQKPLFRWLGTPLADKRFVALDTSHDVMTRRNEVVREVLDWLDKRLGPVKR
ncbi:MAG: protein kinase [Acidobacteria bacterium]|nr:protein kinase [Acidobacteriota bacterium]